MTTTGRRAAALLFAALGIGAALAAAPTPAQLDALQALRLSNPGAFLAQLRAVEARPPPTDPLLRDQLGLLGAQAMALESRFPEALQRADQLARDAADEATRLRAAALAVNVQAASREFLDGQKRLEVLLATVEPLPDSAVRRHVDLVAAVFYNQLSQSEIALRHAERVLAGDAAPVERCAASMQALEARLTRAPHQLDEAEFDGVSVLCAGNETVLAARYVDVLRSRWWIAEGHAGRAAEHLLTRMPDLQATGFAPLLAEAHAELAEALLATGRLDEAQTQTDAVLALSAGLPSGLPLLSARRTRYEIALARGNDRVALGELQAVLTAERAYEDEMRHLLAAYEAGRQESLARQQALALVEQRNAQLTLDAAHSERTTTFFTLLAAPLVLAFVALLGWTWHSRRLRRRLRERMQIDALTTLWTRQQFAEQAAASLAAAERRAQPMALVLLDLDHFSLVNSQHGHLSGDALLAAVGATLARLQEPGRHFGRLGGEEFAVLLPGAGLDEGLAFAERCRSAIAATRATAYDGRAGLAITASFGVVSTTAAGYRLRDLLANADQALYRAKSAGRNRVAAAVVVPMDGAEVPA
jgi:diguanylate cyclase (GGDEF)-like protein